MNLAIQRNVLITGAAGGIGRALVRAFSAAGYRVIATDIDERPGDLPADAAYVKTDLVRLVNNPADAAAFFDSIRAALGKGALSALINNAAIQILGDTDSLRIEDWQATLDVNLSAPFLLTQALLTELEKASGAVVNISSVHAAQTKKRFVAYATSKAALSGMTRAMAVDLGDRIRINAIEPAAIRTDMLTAGFRDNPEGLSRLEAFHPAGRIGEPEEVAALALMLCDSTLPFANGACIALDGGIRGRLHDPD